MHAGSKNVNDNSFFLVGQWEGHWQTCSDSGSDQKGNWTCSTWRAVARKGTVVGVILLIHVYWYILNWEHLCMESAHTETNGNLASISDILRVHKNSHTANFYAHTYMLLSRCTCIIVTLEAQIQSITVAKCLHQIINVFTRMPLYSKQISKDEIFCLSYRWCSCRSC